MSRWQWNSSDVFGLIAVFVIGSIIASLILNPGSIDDLAERFNGFKSSVDQNLQVSESQAQRRSIEIETYDSCSIISLGASSIGMSESKAKKDHCRYQCGRKGMEYADDECRADKLYCYCYPR